VNIKQKYPKLDAHGFLERAFSWINSGIDVGVFYAALELRFTFEKILIKHGFASSNYTKPFEKMNWKPSQLQESLEKEFSQRINLARAYRFFIETDNEPVNFGYFLPIDQELFSMFGRLNKYLHAQWAIPIGLPNDVWQKANSQILRDFAEKLIPHANPKNSLDYLSIPNIKFDELEISDTEIMLKKYWQR
jgi:hypothetical protein